MLNTPLSPPTPHAALASAARPLPHVPNALLAGLTPAQFMSRHWQKKPLLVRAAVPGGWSGVSPAQLFELAAMESVESRLVVRQGDHWRLTHGPLPASALPEAGQAGWTLLVQGVDLHLQAAHELLQRFRFVPDARLDDLMISWASQAGGVGPHFDSYDVFLLQIRGQRRWRIGPQKDLSLQADAPLKILSHFEPDQEYVLEPGDMLYLPARWAHEGTALGSDCMTASIGFRAPQRAGLAAELLQRMVDDFEDTTLYHDPCQTATATPAAIPSTLEAFAVDALQQLLAQRQSLSCALGEAMTEPKPQVWFDMPSSSWRAGALHLDRRTRMMYDEKHLFINGESLRAGGADARLMHTLADERTLSAEQVTRSSAQAQALLQEWFEAGWLHLD